MDTPRLTESPTTTTDEDVAIEIADILAFTHATETYVRAALRWSRWSAEEAKEQS